MSSHLHPFARPDSNIDGLAVLGCLIQAPSLHISKDAAPATVMPLYMGDS